MSRWTDGRMDEIHRWKAIFMKEYERKFIIFYRLGVCDSSCERNCEWSCKELSTSFKIHLIKERSSTQETGCKGVFTCIYSMWPRLPTEIYHQQDHRGHQLHQSLHPLKLADLIPLASSNRIQFNLYFNLSPNLNSCREPSDNLIHLVASLMTPAAMAW